MAPPGSFSSKLTGTRQALSAPLSLNEPLAHVLGYFVGDGNVTKSGICLTCGDEAYARRLADLAGTTLDYVSGLHGSGFKFVNPKAERTCGCGSSFSA